jgi:predicted HTH transcriptional regulator
MITKNQIQFLLGNIENERVERTVSTKDTDKFAKTICAFANYQTNAPAKFCEYSEEELDANRNGLAVFKFDDITTFKVTVMNADLDAVKAMKNGAENEDQNIDKQENEKTVTDENRDTGAEKWCRKSNNT